LSAAKSGTVAPDRTAFRGAAAHPDSLRSILLCYGLAIAAGPAFVLGRTEFSAARRSGLCRAPIPNAPTQQSACFVLVNVLHLRLTHLTIVRPLSSRTVGESRVAVEVLRLEHVHVLRNRRGIPKGLICDSR
jgi:hypothetical protein